MEVNLTPETEARLRDLAAQSGRTKDDLVEDAMAGYLTELTALRQLLDGRYDDVRSGRVKPVDGEESFAALRRNSAKRRASQ